VARHLILDSEALSALASSSRDHKAAKRAQAVLTSAHRAGALIRIPASVLVEAYRGRSADAAVDHVLSRIGAVVPIDRGIARVAGALLATHRLDSCHAVDATVVATAVRLGGGVIATHDPDDFRRLASRFPNVKLLAL
jgi:predicted nucleic acid-binding protein